MRHHAHAARNAITFDIFRSILRAGVRVAAVCVPMNDQKYHCIVSRFPINTRAVPFVHSCVRVYRADGGGWGACVRVHNAITQRRARTEIARVSR